MREIYPIPLVNLTTCTELYCSPFHSFRYESYKLTKPISHIDLSNLIFWYHTLRHNLDSSENKTVSAPVSGCPIRMLAERAYSNWVLRWCTRNSGAPYVDRSMCKRYAIFAQISGLNEREIATGYLVHDRSEVGRHSWGTWKIPSIHLNFPLPLAFWFNGPVYAALKSISPSWLFHWLAVVIERPV